MRRLAATRGNVLGRRLARGERKLGAERENHPDQKCNDSESESRNLHGDEAIRQLSELFRRVTQRVDFTLALLLDSKAGGASSQPRVSQSHYYNHATGCKR